MPGEVHAQCPVHDGRKPDRVAPACNQECPGRPVPAPSRPAGRVLLFYANPAAQSRAQTEAHLVSGFAHQFPAQPVCLCLLEKRVFRRRTRLFPHRPAAGPALFPDHRHAHDGCLSTYPAGQFCFPGQRKRAAPALHQRIQKGLVLLCGPAAGGHQFLARPSLLGAGVQPSCTPSTPWPSPCCCWRFVFSIITSSPLPASMCPGSSSSAITGRSW